MTPQPFIAEITGFDTNGDFYIQPFRFFAYDQCEAERVAERGLTPTQRVAVVWPENSSVHWPTDD